MSSFDILIDTFFPLIVWNSPWVSTFIPTKGWTFHPLWVEIFKKRIDSISSSGTVNFSWILLCNQITNITKSFLVMSRPLQLLNISDYFVSHYLFCLTLPSSSQCSSMYVAITWGELHRLQILPFQPLLYPRHHLPYGIWDSYHWHSSQSCNFFFQGISALMTLQCPHESWD